MGNVITDQDANNAQVISLDTVWCVVPVYNNAATVREVALGCRKHIPHVLVVDDGSTDVNVAQLFAGTDILVVKHTHNQGKGAALMTALEFLSARGGTFMVTIDADGQHYPDDILSFIKELKEDAIFIGCRDFTVANVPESSKFGRKFSNFWFRIETGLAVGDTQSGLRAYPVKYLMALSLASCSYDWEVEVIVRSAWAGLLIRSIPVRVFYAPKEIRVSHFHPFVDNLRITLLHCRLIGRILLPIPHKQLVSREKKTEINPQLFKDPRSFFKDLLAEHATPTGLAAAAFVSIFLAVLPLLSVHMFVILYVVSRLHLNKVMALAVQNICMPPVVPVICIELGHYLLYRQWLTEVSFQVIFWQLKDRVWEWLIGSLIVAPLLATAVALVVFYISSRIHKERVNHAV
jgi:glycosyltransferase involved in cell wall biosynthesis